MTAGDDAEGGAIGPAPGRITELPELIAGLDTAERERVERLFEITRSVGTTDPPAVMEGWLTRQFGSVEAIRRQTIVRVVNRWSLDGTLFSGLRALRPIDAPGDDGRQARVATAAAGTTVATPGTAATATEHADPFCEPLSQTPAASWGRVRGRHAVTGANAAKYDAHHAIIVFDHHDPLAFERDTVIDLFEVGRAWAERARTADAGANAYLLTWNCGVRAGASIRHGHAQALLGYGAYPRVARLRRDAGAYRAATGGSYPMDLVAAHRDLGLAIDRGAVSVIASLTPVKERELVVVGPAGMDERDPAFAGTVADVLLAYRDTVGVTSFNLALHRPPIFDRSPGDGWGELGPMVHLVDRGREGVHSSDIGAMELFAASVVSADPFDLAGQLRPVLRGSAGPGPEHRPG